MTEMPELVVILHSFVGLVAVLVGSQQLPVPRTGPGADSGEHPSDRVFLGIFIVR
ncbi:hypothetical protein ACVXG7_29650 [Enterobacter hormaechei]